jgi:hypothetical protein
MGRNAVICVPPDPESTSAIHPGQLAKYMSCIGILRFLDYVRIIEKPKLFGGARN